MLALRLARGAHPVVLLRRLAVAAAAGGTGFLLLCTMGYALGHPDAGRASVLRLLWCLPPLAATVQLAVAVARTDPGTRPHQGLSAVGLGPNRLMLLAAVNTLVSCTLGSMLALLFFLHLRGDLTGLPMDGDAAELLGAGQSLPLAAVLTLLALVPLGASVAAAVVLRPRRLRPGDERDPAHPEPPQPTPNGLPWGVALMAVGLSVELYAAGAEGSALALPGRLVSTPAGVLAGWAVTALGLAFAGPGLTSLSGRMLQAWRPGAARLLAGRVLQDEAVRIGRPLGVVCAVVSGAIAAFSLYAGPATSFGPLTTLGGALVAGCTLLALLTAAVEARQARAHTTAALLRLGAPVSLLRGAVVLRMVALLAVFGPLTCGVALLAAAPMTS
ncbi:hypothetical protein H9Y04_03815 [Streptomyces sp. TRM66268-LWL]|uniref:Integral membrane protein n=1 Tax=Streptomyces polyasparticus TaxID=2767826 RepID=A0ABR7S995_9ACTN|nr:hypothetical protein [Streptomyces polyasparticus]MBC9711694.1 hypothetical protein [Streptomyces polyasparticus]